ncbi:MAG: ATP synthase epsilon chain [candidate division WS2 bacterium ADurb.Bin280]|uniref:ATP synthase epsilon chain n=1 Tax=candidate division WS2 bacterium ADurb.Bin280 TaxID=1852829 RepID=A0A1V5SCS7_9BACT|nr:MAG: ATP synthase epsilon chain [candidate division WS2 bacterium ADurb.Bin280]
MAKTFDLILSSPEDIIFDQKVVSVSFETANGEITILSDHAPLVTIVEAGIMTIKDENGKEEILALGGGFAKILNNKVKIFSQTAEFADSIDEKRAIEAKERAKESIIESKDKISLADATSLLERNLARIKTIERKKKRSHR